MDPWAQSEIMYPEGSHKTYIGYPILDMRIGQPIADSRYIRYQVSDIGYPIAVDIHILFHHMGADRLLQSRGRSLAAAR